MKSSSCVGRPGKVLKDISSLCFADKNGWGSKEICQLKLSNYKILNTV